MEVLLFQPPDVRMGVRPCECDWIESGETGEQRAGADAMEQAP